MTAERDDYRAHLKQRLTQCDVPESLHAGLVEYLVARRPVGGFLTAVLSNDLRDALMRADPNNVSSLRGLVLFLFNHTTPTCSGSRAAVAAWLADPSPPIELFD